MNKLEVGMYIRTDEGFIAKVKEFKHDYTKGKRLVDDYSVKEVVENYLSLDGNQCRLIESIDYSIPPCYPSDEELEKIKSHIVKSSFNIIDLIEEGDILLLFDKEYGENYKAEVTLDDSNFKVVVNYEQCVLLNLEYELITNEHIELLKILTKEQFESMSYRIGE